MAWQVKLIAILGHICNCILFKREHDIQMILQGVPRELTKSMSLLHSSKNTKEARAGGKCSLTFGLASSEKLLKLSIFIKMQAKFKEYKNLNLLFILFSTLFSLGAETFQVKINVKN